VLKTFSLGEFSKQAKFRQTPMLRFRPERRRISPRAKRGYGGDPATPDRAVRRAPAVRARLEVEEPPPGKGGASQVDRGAVEAVYLGNFVSGVLCGLALGASRGALADGVGTAVAGVAGVVAGTLGGYEFRARLTRAAGGRGFPIALLEDAIAIGLAAWAVHSVGRL